MTHELRLERTYDAPPEAVFDAFVDPSTQSELHGAGNEDWTVHSVETDLRVGGTSTYVMGPTGQEPDTEVRTYVEIDRPRRLVFHHSMAVAQWEAPVETEMTITFEARDGGTLLTMVQTGFETEETRDDFMGGWPTYLETLRGVVEARTGLKARHDR